MGAPLTQQTPTQPMQQQAPQMMAQVMQPYSMPVQKNPFAELTMDHVRAKGDMQA